MKALLSLERVQGCLLQKNNIVFDDAIRNRVLDFQHLGR